MPKATSQYYEDEKAKWDSLVDAHYAQNPEKLLLRPEQDFYSYVRTDKVASAYPGTKDFFGDIRGKRLLEYGCGSGMTASLLAKAGADVTAFDISEKSVATTQLRAQLNNLPNLHAQVGVGEKLPFADASFDLAFGRAVLHHLDVDLAGPELLRVLKPGGKALFIEPLGMNPVLTYVRNHVPYPDKNPVGDDRPLTYAEINKWGRGYSDFHYHEVHFFGMIVRAFPYRWHVRLPVLHKVDRVVLRYAPPLRRFCRYVLIMLVK